MPIEVGDPAPSFTLLDHTGATVSLEDFSGSHLLVYFYPKAFTPGCTTQACDLRDRQDAFTEAGWAIVGISPDPVEKLRNFHSEHRLTFSLLSDEDHTVATAYGAWGIKKNYGREYEGLIRSTFVIGPNGTIDLARRNTKAAGHGDRMMKELLKA
jgi:peroxiredoxin Q/BCP